MKKSLAKILSMTAILLIWHVAATVMDSPLILPSPKSVFFCMGELFKSLDFWTNIASTFIRVVASFSISLLVGSALGILCGRFQFAKDFLALPISILRSTPVVALILLLIFAFNSSKVPVLVSILMSLPVMVSSMSAGFTLSEDDRKIFQMAKVFGFTKMQKIRRIWIPKLKPFFKGAVVSVFGMTWKVVVAGEVLSLPKKSIGSQLATAQVHLESQEVMALSIVIITFSFLMESGLKHFLEEGK